MKWHLGQCFYLCINKTFMMECKKDFQMLIVTFKMDDTNCQ